MKRFTLLSAFFVLAFGGRAHAQMTHTMVQADRVVIGAEFIPRRSDLPMQLIVAAGQTVELPANSIADYIEVAGTLRCARAHDTRLLVTTFVVLPGGTFDCGTQADPIRGRVEIVFRNVAIDTKVDPFLWGNGLLNFGTQTRVGVQKLAFTTVVGDVASGATSLTVSEDPVGWAVGDELLLPDTAQLEGFVRARRESRVTIRAIAGRTVTLSKPLDFEHASIRDPNGTLMLLPRVTNMTRNIVIRSEDPTGTPGHTVNVGPDTHWDIRYNELRGIGRTKNRTLDNTTADATGAITHHGGNEAARYCLHDHHAQGFGSFTVGNVCVGQGIDGGFGKWGYSVHQTSDVVVQDNVMVDFPGAGIVTEDGNEVRVVFRHNFAAYSWGNATGDINCEIANVTKPDGSSDNHNPGACGEGFWQRGMANTYDKNEAWNNLQSGFQLFNQNQIDSKYPSRPGGAADTPFDRLTDFPVAFTDNVGGSNSLNGLEHWGVPLLFKNVRFMGTGNGIFQVSQPVTQAPKSVNLIDPTLVCQQAKAFGISAGDAYVSDIRITGGYIGGCATALQNGGRRIELSGVTLQNCTDLDYSIAPAEYATHTDVRFVPLAGCPHAYITLGDGTVWDGIPADVNPRQHVASTPQRGSRFVFHNWQGTGKDYLIFPRQSIGSNLAVPSSEDTLEALSCPDALTELECWQRYGIATGSEAVDPADIVPLDGVAVGVAREGATPRLGPARLVVTSPTARAAAHMFGPDGRLPTPYVRFTGAFTGDFRQGLVGMLSVDGGTPVRVLPVNSGDSFSDAFNAYTTNVTEGVHEVKTWRVDASEAKIPGSDLTLHYVIGTPPPIVTPPPITCVPPAVLTGGACVTPTPAPQTVTVPNVVGQAQAAASAVLTAAGLRLGTVTTQPSTFAGVVLSESPAPGATVAKDSAVNLVVAVAPPPPPPTARTIVKVKGCQEVTFSDGSVDTQCVHVP